MKISISFTPPVRQSLPSVINGLVVSIFGTPIEGRPAYTNSCYGAVAAFVRQHKNKLRSMNWRIMLFGAEESVAHAILLDDKRVIVDTMGAPGRTGLHLVRGVVKYQSPWNPNDDLDLLADFKVKDLQHTAAQISTSAVHAPMVVPKVVVAGVRAALTNRAENRQVHVSPAVIKVANRIILGTINRNTAQRMLNFFSRNGPKIEQMGDPDNHPWNTLRLSWSLMGGWEGYRWLLRTM